MEIELSHEIEEEDEETTPLFVHSRRPEWGVAMMTREADGRRTYQFQDGSLRKFKQGFYHLFNPVEKSPAVTETLVEDLEHKYSASLDQQRLAAKTDTPPVMSFEEQLTVFHALYPGGFEDASYIEDWRGAEGARRRKRFLDPAIEQAQRLLTEKRLSRLLETGQYTKVHGAMVRVFSKTGLVSPSKTVKPLKAMDPAHHQRLAEALYDLLYGEEHYIDRFREYVLALDAGGTVKVSWPMATALSALVQPERHVCVRRSAFRLQARSLAPETVLKRVPTPKGYRRARKLARRTFDKLEREGMKPRDLLDVRVFIWETLRPKGRTMLEELSRSAA